MKTIEYWEVVSVYDRDETHIGDFANEVHADLVMLRDKNFRSKRKRIVTIFDSVEDFENNTRAKIRERAIAKLTIEERVALGLER